MDVNKLPDFSQFNGVNNAEEFLGKLNIPDGEYAIIDGIRCKLIEGVWIPAEIVSAE